MAKQLESFTIEGGGASYAPPSQFHPSGLWMATTAIRQDWLSRIDCTSGAVEHLSELPSMADSITFAADAQRFAVLGDNYLSLWDCQEGVSLRSIANVPIAGQWPQEGATVWCTPSNQVWIFFADVWMLWNLEDLKCVKKIFPRGRLLRVANDAEGDTWAVAYDDEKIDSPVGIHVVNLSKPQASHSIILKEWHDVIVSPDATTAVWSVPGRDVASIVRLNDNFLIGTIERFQIGSMTCFLADGKQLVAPSEHHATEALSLEILNLATGRRIPAKTDVPFFSRVACSAYASIFAAFVNDSRRSLDIACFWDQDGHCLGEATGHNGYAIFSACKTRFATVTSASWEEYAVSPRHGGSITITNLRT